jgi:hypothetical protein
MIAAGGAYGGRGVRRTDEELRKAAWHLFYEIEMLLAASRFLQALPDPQTPREKLIRNAVVESFTVHLRVLIMFFYSERRYLDDVLAEEFMLKGEWTKLRGEKPAQLAEAELRMGKEVAHLTTSRYSDDESDSPNKIWPTAELVSELLGLLKTFLKHASEARIDPRIPDIVSWYETGGSL